MELYNLVQMRIKDHREALRRQPQHFYLLSGMIRCMECEKPYRSNFQKDRPKEHRKAIDLIAIAEAKASVWIGKSRPCVGRTCMGCGERDVINPRGITGLLSGSATSGKSLSLTSAAGGYFRSASKLEQQLNDYPRLY